MTSEACPLIVPSCPDLIPASVDRRVKPGDDGNDSGGKP
jgi:hypothetical protein